MSRYPRRSVLFPRARCRGRKGRADDVRASSVGGGERSPMDPTLSLGSEAQLIRQVWRHAVRGSQSTCAPASMRSASRPGGLADGTPPSRYEARSCSSLILCPHEGLTRREQQLVRRRSFDFFWSISIARPTVFVTSRSERPRRSGAQGLLVGPVDLSASEPQP
jgi:hypothetical protein